MGCERRLSAPPGRPRPGPAAQGSVWAALAAQTEAQSHSPRSRRNRGWLCGGGVHLNTEPLFGGGVPTPQELASPAGGRVLTPPRRDRFSLCNGRCNDCCTSWGGARPPKSLRHSLGGRGSVCLDVHPPQRRPRFLQYAVDQQWNRPADLPEYSAVLLSLIHI